ncbi:hypothetical protein GAR06_03434 [Micromonospora saelicesensis]|uniref:phage tail protein n=1 Tax=Micromonospora saelicesensis TaxID=285676 RepID=UPI000DC2FC74|nr:phage tail protein [Micromonospora saelicesensis]RAO45243.1 hypothetical protein GAR06_03434 [Micromonospora saelicesensis]
MADRYRAVLAIVTDVSAPPWGELTRSVLPTAFNESGLDWQEVDYVRSAPGLLVAAPAATAGRLAEGFVQALADALPGLSGPVRLGLGLAVGICHRDAKGWFGDAVTTARRLAKPASTSEDVRLAISTVVQDIVGAFGPDYTEVADAEPPYWVRMASGRRLSPAVLPARVTPAVTDIAEVVHTIAEPVASFAEQLPLMLSSDVAPSDVLAWMYRALGVDSPRLLDDRNGRRLLSRLMRCYKRRGTASGLAELIELRYGVDAEILDPGGTTWSTSFRAPLRQPPASVTVFLDTDKPLDGLDEVIRSALPVGVGFQISRRQHR